ncbi:MAG TPA: CBS domain-containing protein [Candidatus Acidoferrales bacterium]|nr:CBS domain-containing protein [Candidatus Acidoferrales bacterium]
MRNLPFQLGDGRKRASIDTVRTILDNKGHDIVSISPGATVYDAIAEMARKEVGALLVLSGSELVGIISERDYARKVILKGKSSKETAVQEVMTPSPVTVTPSHTVDECMRIVTNKRIRHLPVVDGKELRGMVSIGDLVKTIISSQAYTIDQLHTYIWADYPS